MAGTAINFLDYIKIRLPIYKCLGLVFFTFDERKWANLLNFLWFLPFCSGYIYCMMESFHQINSHNYKSVGGRINSGLLLIISISVFSIFAKFVIFIYERSRMKQLILDINKITKSIFGKNNSKMFQKKQFQFLFPFLVIIYLLTSVGCYLTDDELQMEYYITYATSAYVGIFECHFLRILLKNMKNNYSAINCMFLSLNSNEDIVKVCPQSIQAMKCNTMESKLYQIIEIAEIHKELFKICKRINWIYGIPILLVLGVEFTMVTVNSHGLGSFFIEILNGEKRSIILVFISIEWIVLLLGHVAVTINAWRSLSDEAEKTATYVHDIWNKLASRNEIDSKVNHLQLISIQLLNSKLRFTAYGLFPLDWTLLHMIVGAVTTYVVILIQFEMASSSKATLSTVSPSLTIMP